MAHLRLCIVSADEVIQETLTQIFTSAGLKKIIFLNDIFKEEQVSDIIEMVDVVVLFHERPCMLLRQRGYSGPLILATCSGFYIDKHFTDLADLILHMPVSSYSLFLLNRWLRKLCEGDSSILRYQEQPNTSNLKYVNEDKDGRKWHGKILSFYDLSTTLKNHIQRLTLWTIIGTILKLPYFFILQLIVLIKMIIRACFYVNDHWSAMIGYIYYTIFEAEEAIEDAKYLKSRRFQHLTLNEIYGNIYTGDHHLGKILKTKFAFDEESTKWGTGVSMKYYKRDISDMALRFACQELETSYNLWLEYCSGLSWGTMSHHAKTALAIAYLFCVMLLTPNSLNPFNMVDLFMLLIMAMVFVRVTLRRISRHFLNACEKCMGLNISVLLLWNEHFTAYLLLIIFNIYVC